MIEKYIEEQNDNKNSAENYETLLRKEEASIRQHISVEHQLKLQYENLSEKFDIIELEKKELIKKIDKLKLDYEQKLEVLNKNLKHCIKQKKSFIVIERNLRKKLEQKDNEIIHLQNKIKLENNYNNSACSVMSKTNSIFNLNQDNKKENKDKNINNKNKEIKEYNENSIDPSYHSNYNTTILINNDKLISQKNSKSINNKKQSFADSVYYSKNSIHKNYSINYNINQNNNNNQNSNQRNKNKVNYITKIQNNITNLIDYLQEQNNLINSPSEFNRTNTSAIKKEKINQNKPKDIKSTNNQVKNKSQSKDSSYGSNNNKCDSDIGKVMLNKNLLSSNDQLDKFKLYKKINENRRSINRKINEMTRNQPKIVKRTLSAFQKRRNSSPNFGNKSQNQSNLRRKKTITPNKDIRQKCMSSEINSINFHYNNNTNNPYQYNNNYYGNNSNKLSGKKENIKKSSTNTIDINKYNKVNNYFRKKTPNRIKERKEISPNFKYNSKNNYCCSSSNSKKKKSNNYNNKNQNDGRKNSANGPLASSSTSNLFCGKNIGNTNINSIINNNIGHILINNINFGNKLVISNIINQSNINNPSSSLRKFVITKCSSTNNIIQNKY